MDAKKFLPENDVKSVLYGDPIPLNLQVCDGRDDLEVFADIIGPDGKRYVSEIRLPHFSKGLYISTAIEMPPVPRVFAQYVIKKNGQILMDYEIVTEIFFGREKPEEPPKWHLGWVRTKKFAEGFKVGYAKKANA